MPEVFIPQCVCGCVCSMSCEFMGFIELVGKILMMDELQNLTFELSTSIPSELLIPIL